MPGRRVLAAAVVAAAVATIAGSSPPHARAHGSDPAIRSVVDDIEPKPPPAVRITVESSVAAEVVVSNPTATPVEALDAAGRVFLRISAAGVEADVSSPAFVESSSPAGAVAATPATAPPRFVRLSVAPVWSWFDHRLHPPDLVVPREATQRVAASRLAEWAIPLRYGTTAITVRGHVEYRRPRGRIVATLRSSSVPAGIGAAAVEGRLPGVFVRNATPRVLRILDAAGDPYAEVGPAGVHVNRASPVHVADRRARGEVVTAETRPAELERVSAAAAHTWLDPRLRPPQGALTAEVQLRRVPTTLVEWRIPYRLGSVAGELVGTTSFVPFPNHRSGDDDGDGDGGRRALATTLVVGAASTVVAAVVMRRRVGRAARPHGERRPTHDDSRT